MTEIACIFDMDGVIVDNFNFHQQAWKIFCDRHKLRLDSDFKSGVFGGTNRDHLEVFFKRKLFYEEIETYETEKEEIYREIYNDHIKPIDGLIKFLKELKNHNIPIALATSSPAVNVDFVTGKTQTRHYFDVILDAKDVINGKPDPEIYLKTAAKLNVDPALCIVFEDSKMGIESALRAGMKVVGLSTTHKKNEIENTSLVIPDFRNLDVLTLQRIMG